jgi:hypothetical protein
MNRLKLTKKNIKSKKNRKGGGGLSNLTNKIKTKLNKINPFRKKKSHNNSLFFDLPLSTNFIYFNDENDINFNNNNIDVEQFLKESIVVLNEEYTYILKKITKNEYFEFEPKLIPGILNAGILDNNNKFYLNKYYLFLLDVIKCMKDNNCIRNIDYLCKNLYEILKYLKGILFIIIKTPSYKINISNINNLTVLNRFLKEDLSIKNNFSIRGLLLLYKKYKTLKAIIDDPSNLKRIFGIPNEPLPNIPNNNNNNSSTPPPPPPLSSNHLTNPNLKSNKKTHSTNNNNTSVGPYGFEDEITRKKNYHSRS